MLANGCSSVLNITSEADVPLEQRVAVLEERTAPKPKLLLDKLKDWGGVVSLAIALAYSFPLGLWDRFIETEKKKAAGELATLREAIEQSTSMIVDGAKTLAGISDPYLYDIVGRTVNTRLYVLMTKHQPAFERRRQDFSAPELMVIGYNFLQTNQVKVADSFLQYAQRQAAGDLLTKVEVMRLRAKALFMPGPFQNKVEARKLFSGAIAQVAQGRSYQEVASYISLTAEWGIFELLDGDWTCGQQQIAMTRRTYEDFAPFLNDHGNLGRLIEQKTKPLKPKPGQLTKGC